MSAVIAKVLDSVELPRMVRVRQVFKDDALADVAASVRAEIMRPEIAGTIRKDMTVAVGVGSRGLADLPIIVNSVITALKDLGALPFIVPAMGSHGGSSAQGQLAMLASLGVTEESADCDIRSDMGTVEVGRLANGLPIAMDRIAMEADGIVIINRIKPHTSFSGTIESGLAKMITIGLGKQTGADACHSLGFGKMAEQVIAMTKVKIEKTPILFGLATVENAYDHVRLVEAVLAKDILQREAQLLDEARSSMPRILFSPLDVLVVDKMGKDYSGLGADPNITGRGATPYVKLSQQVGKLVMLDLSAKSQGNAAGVGLADICTRRLVVKIDFEATYMNHITSTALVGGRLPVIMEHDRHALQLAVKTCNAPPEAGLRLVRLTDTLHLEYIWISEPMLEEARTHEAIEIVGEPKAFEFAPDGSMNGRTL
ncbi:MAG: lactate racemase domain-containing protein [Sulfitobacter sp.]